MQSFRAGQPNFWTLGATYILYLVESHKTHCRAQEPAEAAALGQGYRQEGRGPPGVLADPQ